MRKADKTDVQLMVLMTAEEKAAAIEKAAACGISLAELVRTIVENITPETVKQAIDNREHA